MRSTSRFRVYTGSYTMADVNDKHDLGPAEQAAVMEVTQTGVTASGDGQASQGQAPLDSTAANEHANPEANNNNNVSAARSARTTADGLPPLIGEADLGLMDSDDDDDILEDEDDMEASSGEETDVEDNDEIPPPVRLRQSNPDLPETVTVLETEKGCRVYLVGTAHFSLESQEDVAKVIQATQPDVVLLELCRGRVNILDLDEEMLLREAQDINMEKIKLAIKQSGVVQGIMHILLLSMSAHLTRELGMAPGGEFRRAYKEACQVPGCHFTLGDRPINITLRRALGALSVWQKLCLAWALLTNKDPIKKEDVEKCKQRDILEQMLREMTGEYPSLHRVFVEERDIYLAHSLRQAATCRLGPEYPDGYLPSVVVGVVGIGHVPGIVANWSKDLSIKEITEVPPPSVLFKVIRWSVKISLLGAVTWGCYRLIRLVAPLA